MVSREELAQLAVQRMISKMPQEDQEKINECLDKLRVIIAEYGRLGQYALPLLMFETSKTAEEASTTIPKTSH